MHGKWSEHVEFETNVVKNVRFARVEDLGFIVFCIKAEGRESIYCKLSLSVLIGCGKLRLG